MYSWHANDWRCFFGGGGILNCGTCVDFRTNHCFGVKASLLHQGQLQHGNHLKSVRGMTCKQSAVGEAHSGS